MEQHNKQINTPVSILTALLNEFSAVTDYRTLQDSLPQRLTALLKCRCILFYQRIGETLQLVAGSFDDMPGWSSSLLSFAHINPINLNSAIPEACAWRERHVIVAPAEHARLVAVPLIYRQRGIGVLVAIRCECDIKNPCPQSWTADEIVVLEAIAGVVALLLENTRLLEHDRERIHELSLLNSISSQMNCSMYEPDRLRKVIIQRTREISAADLCELIGSSSEPASEDSWVTAVQREMLFQHFHEQRSLSPLIIERPGDPNNSRFNDYLGQLPVNIKTFFALPLLSSRGTSRRGGPLQHGSRGTVQELSRKPKVLGVIVGAYYRPWKLRRAELVLLQVLANQASAVMENIQLMADVLEARNEARKLLRQVLEDQRLKALILESIPSGLITADRNGCITMFNRAASAILGYHAYEVLGQSLHNFLDLQLCHDRQNDDETATAKVCCMTNKNLLPGDIRKSSIMTVDRQDHEIVLDVDILLLRDESGQQRGTLITFSDVTSVYQLEEEKRRLDRLASLGEMAANVAHEVRNPLASIKTSMQMLMHDLVGSEQPLSTCIPQHEEQSVWAQEAIVVVLKEVERLDSIVRDLLLFAKQRHLHRVKCNLKELSDQVLQLIQPQCIEANVLIHQVYGEMSEIWVDVAQIEQVLLNLYMNALQAMPDGGILTVTCNLLAAERALLDTECARAMAKQEMPCDSYCTSDRKYELSSPQWLEIAVSDTGVGIPPEQLERIFQPFFTTKAHGIGLGLAITRRLVEDHGGYMRVEGHFGYGATIAVRLPLITEEDLCQKNSLK